MAIFSPQSSAFINLYPVTFLKHTWEMICNLPVTCPHCYRTVTPAGRTGTTERTVQESAPTFHSAVTVSMVCFSQRLGNTNLKAKQTAATWGTFL